MSPEIKKPSHGYAIRIRREKEEARRQFQPIPSWENVSGTIELRTYSHYDLNDLYNQNRFILKEFYDARYDIALGKGSKKLNEFMRKYTQNEKSKTYNPELIDNLSPLFHIIRDSFPSQALRKK